MTEKNRNQLQIFRRRQPMPLLHILWDDSHIWGLLAARAAGAMEIPHRLVRCSDIARNLLMRERPSLLLVPGGSARCKAQGLGKAGLAAIQDYVRAGGSYLGFCGGAGLALTAQDKALSIGLCSWQRASFDDRLQHFMSGHLHVALLPGAASSAPANQPPAPEKGDKHTDDLPLIPVNMPKSPLLPVWWPGRFAPESGDGIEILASYERPGNDFWLADLPIADLPEDIFAIWRELYGLCLTPDFLTGQPGVIHGRYGRGHYILSYSHLETPASVHANRWLAHLLRVLGGLCPASENIPPWSPRNRAILWEDPFLDQLDRLLEEVLQTGLRHGLLFHRTDWLMGWRTGIPGANLNNIWAALSLIRSLQPASEALAYWNERKEQLAAAADMFSKGCIRYLLAERLAMTLAPSLPSVVPSAELKAQRESLFGPPMRPGGLYRTLIDALDTLAYLQLS